MKKPKWSNRPKKATKAQIKAATKMAAGMSRRIKNKKAQL
jgi:hypothetical protein